MNEFVEIPANNMSISKKQLIFGIGVNDAEYKVSLKINGKQLLCPYYRTWKGMLSRCYSTAFKEKQATYKDCLVCTDWLLFSNFKA